ILPLTFCRLANGRHGWRWHAFSAPRPFYGLDRLAQFTVADVLLVEGEKTADAAQNLFPSYVAVTWPGGAEAVAKADWSILNGRRIVIWPDADASGHRATGRLGDLLFAAGAISVSVVV